MVYRIGNDGVDHDASGQNATTDVSKPPGKIPDRCSSDDGQYHGSSAIFTILRDAWFYDSALVTTGVDRSDCQPVRRRDGNGQMAVLPLSFCDIRIIVRHDAFGVTPRSSAAAPKIVVADLE